MTNREREYAAAGFGHCEGIEMATTIEVPATGRIITRTADGWEAQRYGSNSWELFPDPLTALIAATPPKGGQWSAVAECTANKLGSRAVTPDEAEANARLIAAAPELLAALRDLVEATAAEHEENEDESPHDQEDETCAYCCAVRALRNATQGA